MKSENQLKFHPKMEKTFFIQNMVCDRCKSTVEKLITDLGGRIIDLQLGRVIIRVSEDFNVKIFENELHKNGFNLMEDQDVRLTEQIKISLLDFLNSPDLTQNLSERLSKKLHKDYSLLSKTFSHTQGETIEKYFIKLKIEKVKELIQMQRLSFSEIAYQLGYNSISHLSGQFKAATGLTMSQYRDNGKWKRRSLDKIL